MVTVLLDPELGIDKSVLMAALDEREIDSRPFFHPLSSIPAYQDTAQARVARARNEVSYRLAPYGLNLPSALNLDIETVDRVCNALKEILGQA